MYTEGWSDKIRTHPFTRNLIEKVTTLDVRDYLLSPSELHAKLLSHVDTVDNKLRQIMQHPKFLSARNWLHTSIRNVSWLQCLTHTVTIWCMLVRKRRKNRTGP